ncbi:hypothetical protein BGZ82_001162 [Podila clonocystis]|nr:hypothetical protein BGZ82_001162 [Podila clonocystis]
MGANKISGFQQITPESFRIFPQRIERLVPWIRRELQAILTLSPLASSSSSSRSDPNPSGELWTGLELIREYITAVLKRYDLQTDQAQDLLRDFLHEHTEHFVHELMAFARSPFSMGAMMRRRRDRMVRQGADQRIARTGETTGMIDPRVLAEMVEGNETGAGAQIEAGAGPEVGGTGAGPEAEAEPGTPKGTRESRAAAGIGEHEAASDDQILILNRGGRTPSASSKETVVESSTSSFSSTLEHVSDKDDRTTASRNVLHGLLQAKLEREKALYLARQG